MSPRFPIFASSSEARTATLQSLLIAAIVITGLYVARGASPARSRHRVELRAHAGTSVPAAAEGSARGRRGDRRHLRLRPHLRAWLAHVATGDAARRGFTPLSARACRKISALRKSATGSPALEKATEAIKDLERELANPTPEPKVGAEPSPPEQAEEGRKPIPVEIHEPPPRSLELFQRIAGTVLPPLATAGIVILFVIFILLQREFAGQGIRLLGASDMQRTTSAMNDAAERLSKYFVDRS